MKTRLLWLAFLLSFALNVFWIIGAGFDWRVPLAVLGAWYLADLISGVVHMYMDYQPCVSGAGLADIFFYDGSRASDEYLALKKQIMARVGLWDQILFDFKTHHPRPEALGRRGFISQVRSSVFYGCLPFSLALNGVCFFWRVPAWLIVGAVVLTAGCALTQYFHGSLHREDNPWFITAMRRMGLLMTPAAHAKHHATLQQDFATISGWSNPLVNPVFRFLRGRGMLDPVGLEPS